MTIPRYNYLPQTMDLFRQANPNEVKYTVSHFPCWYMLTIISMIQILQTQHHNFKGIVYFQYPSITPNNSDVPSITCVVNKYKPWASYQLRKIADCACAGNVFHATAGYQYRHASRHVPMIKWFYFIFVTGYVMGTPYSTNWRSSLTQYLYELLFGEWQLFAVTAYRSTTNC